MAFVRRVLGLVVLAVASGRTLPAGAATVPMREQNLSDALELAAISPCFDRTSLGREIERWLERDRVDERLRIKLVRIEDRWAFSIAVGSEPPLVRAFPELPPDCEGQTSAIALSIALAIDAIVPAAPSRPRADRFTLTVDGAVTTPLPDRMAIGGASTLRVRAVDWFRAGLGIVSAVAKDQAIRSDLPARFDVWFVAARLDGCGVWDATRVLSLLACAGPWMGVTTTAARGLAGAGTEARFSWAAAATAEVEVRLTRAFGLHLGADGLAWLRRSRVQVRDTGGQTVEDRAFPDLTCVVRFGPSVFF